MRSPGAHGGPTSRSTRRPALARLRHERAEGPRRPQLRPLLAPESKPTCAGSSRLWARSSPATTSCAIAPLRQPGREVTVAVRVAGVDGWPPSTYRVPGDATFVQVERASGRRVWASRSTALLCALLLALALGILLVRRGRGPRCASGSADSVHCRRRVAGARWCLTARAPGGAERSLERTRWWAGLQAGRRGRAHRGRPDADPHVHCARDAPDDVPARQRQRHCAGRVLRARDPLGRSEVRRHETRSAVHAVRRPASRHPAGHRLGHPCRARARRGAVDGRGGCPTAQPAEFQRVVGDEALGVPLEEALRSVQERVGSREVLQIALVAQIQREAGGNLAEVLDRITEALRQRAELRRMVQALTAQGRLSRWVVTAIPLVLLLIVSLPIHGTSVRCSRNHSG